MGTDFYLVCHVEEEHRQDFVKAWTSRGLGLSFEWQKTSLGEALYVTGDTIARRVFRGHVPEADLIYRERVVGRA